MLWGDHNELVTLCNSYPLYALLSVKDKTIKSCVSHNVLIIHTYIKITQSVLPTVNIIEISVITVIIRYTFTVVGMVVHKNNKTFPNINPKMRVLSKYRGLTRWPFSKMDTTLKSGFYSSNGVLWEPYILLLLLLVWQSAFKNMDRMNT